MPNNTTRKKPLGERLASIANYHSKSAVAERARLNLQRELASLPVTTAAVYSNSFSAKNKNNNGKKCNEKYAPKPKFNIKTGKHTTLYKAWKAECNARSGAPAAGGKRNTRKNSQTRKRKSGERLQ